MRAPHAGRAERVVFRETAELRPRGQPARGVIGPMGPDSKAPLVTCLLLTGRRNASNPVCHANWQDSSRIRTKSCVSQHNRTRMPSRPHSNQQVGGAALQKKGSTPFPTQGRHDADLSKREADLNAREAELKRRERLHCAHSHQTRQSATRAANVRHEICRISHGAVRLQVGGRFENYGEAKAGKSLLFQAGSKRRE